MNSKKNQLISKLKLPFLAENWDEFIKKLEKKPKEAIDWWLKKEDEHLNHKTEQRRFNTSKLLEFTPLAKVDWLYIQKPLDLKKQIENLISKNLIESNRDVIFFGPEGVGKTMLAKNLGHQMLLKGYSCLFTTAAKMIDDLNSATHAIFRKRILKKYTSPSILILDEVCYLSCNEKSADNLFEVISSRYDTPPRSTIITTNLAFRDWPKQLGGASCTTSIVDRLVHNASTIEIITDKSFRLKEHLELNKKGV